MIMRKGKRKNVVIFMVMGNKWDEKELGNEEE